MVTVPTTICLLFRIPETHKVLLSPRKESLEENRSLMQVMEHLVWKQSPVRPFLWASQTFNLQRELVNLWKKVSPHLPRSPAVQISLEVVWGDAADLPDGLVPLR